MKVLQDLKDEAQELLDFGNSREHARGFGMLDVINVLERYVIACEIFLALLDSTTEEQEKILMKQLNDLKL
jgi:hypothetical protein